MVAEESPTAKRERAALVRARFDPQFFVAEAPCSGRTRADYTKKQTKKTKRIALLSSLRRRANDGDILVVKGFEFSEPKTKDFASALKNMETLGAKTLVVIDKPNINTVKSARNIPGVRVVLADSIATYDVVWADKVVIASDAVKKMEEVFAS